MSHISLIAGSLCLAHIMIGAATLLAPPFLLKLGYVPILVVILYLGSANTYTASIMMKHCGNCLTVHEMADSHFENPSVLNLLYDLAALVYYAGVCISYFQLGVLQIEGLVGSN